MNTSIAKTIREQIFREMQDIIRFYSVHGRKNGWNVPTETDAYLTAKKSTFLMVAKEQHRCITMGLPIHRGVISLVLRAYERGDLVGYPECDITDLKLAMG